MFGVALFYGDGMITPAISVLSAVEGVEGRRAEPGVAGPPDHDRGPRRALRDPALRHPPDRPRLRPGDGRLVRASSPPPAWPASLAHPAIVKALSPHYGVEFFGDHFGIAFISLGAIVLTITGAEALYADMGHFGRKPISRAWFFVVFPALTLNYMGQGSLILDTPSAIDNPFFLLIPHWGRIPMVVLATVATVIASQAVISGAFSVTRQAVQLGFLPRLTIRHTSAREIGQVYVPAVNWFLLAAVVALVLGFGSSTRLASAYGIAVTGTITVDTLLFLVVARALWRKPGWLVALGAARLLHRRPRLPRRQPDQGRARRLVPALGRGRRLHRPQHLEARQREGPRRRGSRRRARCAPSSSELRAMDPPAVRVPGTAVYLNARRETTPLALRAGVEHTGALHETVVIISIETTKAPYVPGVRAPRRRRPRLRGRRHHPPHRPLRLPGHPRRPPPARPRRRKPASSPTSTSTAPSTSSPRSRSRRPPPPACARWRKRLFVAMARNAASPVDYFHLPRDRTVTLGSTIEL